MSSRMVTVSIDDGAYAVTISIPLDNQSPAVLYRRIERMLHAADEAFNAREGTDA